MPDYLEALRTGGDALLHAAGRDPAAVVPTCPGWTTTDLVAHVGRLYRYVARQARSSEKLPRDETAVPAGEEFAAAADALAEVLVVLSEIGPEAPAWNWHRNEPNVAGYWRRRMALETAIHRFDAENATGSPQPVEPGLACDGVEEVLTGFLPARRGRAKEDLTGTVHLHATDAPPGAPAEWTVELGPRGSVTVRRAHEKADGAMRGPAGQLFLAVWDRPAQLDRFGDATLLGAVRAGS